MRLASFIAFWTVSVGLVIAIKKTDADPIHDSLAKAKLAHNEALSKARGDFLAAVDKAINTKAKAGDLDGVRNLRAQKETFETSGTLPTAPSLKGYITDYERAVKQAHRKLDGEYEAAVREYTKALKIEQAEAVQEELRAFRRNSGAAAGAVQVQFDYSFYEWSKGDKPVKMLHKDEGFCYLAGISGQFQGLGESAQITLGKDGFWYLSGETRAAGGLSVRAVGVRTKTK